MEKFKCKKCGFCCSNFGKDKALPFFEWEISKIKKEAEKRSIKLRIKPLNLMFDKKLGIYFFPQYGMLNEPCPFLKNNKCSIYHKRPLVCKMFPVVKNPLVIKQKADIDCFNFCPNYDIKLFLKENSEKNFKELNSIYNKIFGKANKFSFKASSASNQIDKIILNLIKQKKIELRKPSEIEEEIFKAVPVLEFLIKAGHITKKQKSELIKKF